MASRAMHTQKTIKTHERIILNCAELYWHVAVQDVVCQSSRSKLTAAYALPATSVMVLRLQAGELTKSRA